MRIFEKMLAIWQFPNWCDLCTYKIKALSIISYAFLPFFSWEMLSINPKNQLTEMLIMLKFAKFNLNLYETFCPLMRRMYRIFQNVQINLWGNASSQNLSFQLSACFEEYAFGKV
jgi:hypothetical protein